MYVKGIDFCLSNNFPSNDGLLAFGGDALKGYGIYVNSNPAEVIPGDFMVLLGASKANLPFGGFSATQLLLNTRVLSIYRLKTTPL